jgi:MFS family permease
MTVRGGPTILVGILLSVPAITWTGGTWIVDRLANRIDRRLFMVAGLLCVASEMIAMALTAIPSVPLAVPALAWALGALGMGMAYPSFSLTIIESAAAGQEGAVSASMKLVEALGSALGAGISGAIIAAGPAVRSQASGTAAAFVVVAAVAVMAIFLASRAARRPRAFNVAPASALRTGRAGHGETEGPASVYGQGGTWWPCVGLTDDTPSALGSGLSNSLCRIEHIAAFRQSRTISPATGANSVRPPQEPHL